MSSSNIYPNRGFRGLHGLNTNKKSVKSVQSVVSIHPFLAGLLGNLAIAILKLSFGLFGYSKLVLMDGLFSLMSAAVFLLPWQAEVLDKKKSDERHPYGLGKVLFLSMAAVGFLGLIIAIHMLFYSLMIMGWLEMHRFHTGAVMVTAISIMANEVLYRYLMDKSKSLSNAIIALSARYNRIDVWISSFVLFLLILASLGARYLERAGVIAISIIVSFVGFSMIFKGFSGIMDKVPPQKVLDRIRSCAHKVKEVKDVVNIKARYVGTLLHIDMSIIVDENISMEHAGEIARNVKTRLIERIPFAKDVNVIIA